MKLQLPITRPPSVFPHTIINDNLPLATNLKLYRLSNQFTFCNLHSHPYIIATMRGNAMTCRVHLKGKEDDYVIFVDNAKAVKDWKSDRTIPLAQVVNGWKIFVTHK